MLLHTYFHSMLAEFAGILEKLEVTRLIFRTNKACAGSNDAFLNSCGKRNRAIKTNSVMLKTLS